MASWVELAFTASANASEPLSDALFGAGASGVEERDGTTLAATAADRVTLVAWVAAADVAAFLERVRSSGIAAEVVARERDDAEWRDAWKRYFTARKVGAFVLVPSWESYVAAAGEVTLALDPGRAFGTGGHASTRLCLEVLSDERARTVGRVLDVGCGSGILAIAAARLWPEARGVGVDLDEEAASVSRENAEANGVAGRLQFSTTPLAALSGAFDVVLANIQPEVLIPMAPALVARLAAPGLLVLSGILVEAAAPVVQAYVAAGLAPVGQRDEEDWRALVFARRAA